MIDRKRLCGAASYGIGDAGEDAGADAELACSDTGHIHQCLLLTRADQLLRLAAWKYVLNLKRNHA